MLGKTIILSTGNTSKVWLFSDQWIFLPPLYLDCSEMSFWSVQLFAVRSHESICPQASLFWAKDCMWLMCCLNSFMEDTWFFPLSFSILYKPVQSCSASLQKSQSATGDPTACEQVYCTCWCWQYKQEKGTDALESFFFSQVEVIGQQAQLWLARGQCQSLKSLTEVEGSVSLE